jgi:hypothetical protein
MRINILLALLAATAVGCAHSTAVAPGMTGGDPGLGLPDAGQAAAVNDPHRLFGEWRFFIDAEHESVDVVPRREARFHLNALKFLESYCTDCLKITGIKNNGDSTIDLTVQITHPFKGYPQYTGFDVKGIIMFSGSYEYPADPFDDFHVPSPTFLVSWRNMGDPELLNADGYTPRWSPQYDSGSDLPIFNYWKGKYASEGPFADLNAFLNFYSVEERHMFAVDAQVSRTYKIYMPTSKIVAGYAVEACWEPPTVMPVTNPLTDFPVTANQTEAYRFHYVVNNGDVVTDCSECCGTTPPPCSDLRVELGYYPAVWESLPHPNFPDYPDRATINWPPVHNGDPVGSWDMILQPCSQTEWYSPDLVNSCRYGNGTQRIVVYNYVGVWDGSDWAPEFIAYEVFDYTVNDPNQ